MSGGRAPGADELLAGFSVLVGSDGAVGDKGEHHWLCPTRVAPKDRALLDAISRAFSEQVGEQAAADELGSIADLVYQIRETVEETTEAGGSSEARLNEFLSMSLGYWLDCLVVEEVMDRTGASERQVLDVAVLRESVRRDSAAEGARGDRAIGGGDE
jgi:hypothetical protein